MTYRAIRDHVLVAEMNFKERFTSSGLWIPPDDKTDAGIRPRWARVTSVGPDQETIRVGQWVMVGHGRWTRGIEIDGETIRRVDFDDILLVSDEEQRDETFGIDTRGHK